MANDLNLKLTLIADGKQLSGSLKAAQGEVNNFAIKADHAGTKAAGSFGKARQGVESISKQLEVAQNRLVQFAMAGGALSALHSVVKIADDYGEMSERIRMATTSAHDYDLVQKRLQETAGGTYRALSEAQELYIQTADALRSLGYNTEQQLDITDSLSYSFVTNATSAEKAAGAINAFSRSIQTGKVSALDWQSLLMATPTIVDDIATATGKTTYEVRNLGIQGKLGLGELTEGLRLARDENQALADDMNTTIGDAIIRLRGNFGVYIGELNQGSETTYKLAAGIALLAENVQSVMTVALVGGAAATGRYTIAVTASTAASVKKTLAQRAAVVQELQLAQAHEVATRAAVAQAAHNRLLMGSHAASRQAVAAHEAALKRLAVAQAVNRAGGTALLGIMTGPVGLALTAAAVAASFVDWSDGAKDAAVGTDILSESVDKLTAKQARQRLQLLESGYKEAQKEVNELSARIEYLNVQLKQFPSGKGADSWRASLVDLEGSLDTATQKVEEYNRVQQLLNDIMNERDTVTEPTFVDPEAEKAIQAIIDRLQQQYDQLRLNEEQYLRLQMRNAGAIPEQVDLAVSIQKSTEALKSHKKAQEEAAAAAQKLTDEHEAWLTQAVAAIDPARELEDEIKKLQGAWDNGIFNNSNLDSTKFYAYVDGLKKKLAELNGVKIQDPAVKLGNAMQTTAGGLRDVAGAMQGMHEQGTRGYQEMAVAMQATNVLAAIGAVLEQGKGDPYSAFARMSAMAAAVAALGVQVSMMGGDFPDDAAKQQATQGTGTVLGDSAAKSESIAHSVDITASATSQLVGINRDMLRALNAMQAGISGATVQIAQGAKSTDFGTVYKPTNAFDLTSKIGQEYYSLPVLKQVDQFYLGVFSSSFEMVGKMLGGSSKVTDKGIQIIGGSLSDLIEDVVVNSYQVTKSKKYKWSSSKTRTNYQNLGDDVSDQFSLVFESLADSVYAGAVALGLSSAEVERQINEYTIATQKISTKGLTAEEQQKEIEAVFSSIFDGLAGNVVTFLPEFQQAGEGLGETLARVATNVQVTEEAVSRLGFQAQRLGAEQFAELSVSLIEAAGGLEQFINGMGAFVDKFASEETKFSLASSDMERALKAVGLAVPDSRDGMWDLMQSLDASTDAGRAQIAALLELTSTSDAYYKMLEDHNSTLQGLLGDDALADYFKDLSGYIRAESQAIEQDYKERINLLERQSSLSKQLGDYVAKLRLSDLSPAGPAEKLAQAGDEFAALLVRAQAGDLEAAAKLQGAADTYLKNADDYYGRSDIYTTIFEDVAKQLEILGLDFAASSTEEHIKSLNEQMLAEQQQQRDLLQGSLDWAVAQYSKLTSIEHLLSVLPGNLGAVLQGQLNVEDLTPPSKPVRPINGSHATGLARVPFDGYIAELHKGEAVLTASENRALSQFDTAPLLSELKSIRSELAQLRSENSQLRADNAQLAVRAENQRNSQIRTAEQLERNSRTPVRVS